MTPIPAKDKKTNPVTSSQSCPSTRPKWDAVARTALVTAPKVRERCACCAMTRVATRAATPSFRPVEALDIPFDLINITDRGFVCRASGVQYRGREQVGHETL